jgi:DNA-binding response OmpR family regulator
MAAARILIVDDDPDARDLFNLFLRGNGYETSYAADAYGAIAVARREPPDAVVLDYSLPGGDALVVLERLRRVAALATVPVIVVTAYRHQPFESLALAAGAAGFLEKPLDPQRLLALLEQALAPLVPARAPSPGRLFLIPADDASGR